MIYRLSIFAALAILTALSAGGQQAGGAAEVSTQEATPAFKSTSNLVSVPVVVRDAKGRAVGNLAAEDFRLFDSGKPQLISRFVIERAGQTAGKTTPAPQSDATGAQAPADAPAAPDRFVAYLFDDVHLTFPDLVYARDAARRNIDGAANPNQRVALYTTSGATMQDFTADRDKIHQALAALHIGTGAMDNQAEHTSCPPETYYMADQIINHRDLTAWAAAATDALACGPYQASAIVTERMVDSCLNHMPINPPPPTGFCPDAVMAAQREARVRTGLGDQTTEVSFDALRKIVTKMTQMPGQRMIVLVSPGFIVGEDRLPEQTSLIERAIRANIVVGALDARGLYTGFSGASERAPNLGAKSSLATREAIVQADIMAGLAAGTGGKFIQNTNDYDDGFRRIADPPETLYILGFTPSALKLDGTFHSLKVTLRAPAGLSVQARNGYYAAKYNADPKARSRQQIEEAFFSGDQIRDMPVSVRTQFFRQEAGQVNLTVVATVDAKKLTFRHEGDRNSNEVTVVTGVFDSDGNYVSGVEKLVTLRLTDDTLRNRIGAGLAVRSSFNVTSGQYTVRMVARDAVGELLAAESTTVAIP